MDWNTQGFPNHHQLPELAQTHVYRLSDDMRPSHPLSSPSPPVESFPTSGYFPMSQFFTSGDQSIGDSASTSVLPMNIQDWFPLGLIGLISLQSKGLSKVFSSTTVQQHQFFSALPSLWSSSHIHTWLLERLPWLPWWYRQVAAAAAAKLLQSCPTLCDPIDKLPTPNFLQEASLLYECGD